VFPSLQDTFTKDMQELEQLGFNTIFAHEIHNIYPCDGVVFRVNSNNRFSELGFTSKHPRGAYAKKERQEAVEAVILSVEWGVGKSGKVTPVAILSPIKIGDKTVSRATLNNPGFIEMLGINIGDTVGVILGGDVIPCITHKVEA
jgi:DNA ligase (NAD+)